jgi:hypothetical protein
MVRFNSFVTQPEKSVTAWAFPFGLRAFGARRDDQDAFLAQFSRLYPG